MQGKNKMPGREGVVGGAKIQMVGQYLCTVPINETTPPTFFFDSPRKLLENRYQHNCELVKVMSWPRSIQERKLSRR